MAKVSEVEAVQPLVEWLREAAVLELAGCQIQAHDGTVLYTPDGEGNYHALWTRDFAYMVANAWDLFPVEDIRACITILLGGQREDGCVPDRVQADGLAVYSAGSVERPLGAPPTDNSQFMVNLVYTYVTRTGDVPFALKVLHQLRIALDYIPLSTRGLVVIPACYRRSPYGFTDTIGKTGELLFSSLLYWQACKEMAEICVMCGVDAAVFVSRADKVVANLDVLWDPVHGAYLAATETCAQVDVWGNAYTIACGFLDDEHTLTSRKVAVLDFLQSRYADYVFKGQVRHLLKGTYWERTLMPVTPGSYQNGAYWATASGWVITALAQRDSGLAVRMLQELVTDFKTNGIHECVGDAYAKLNHYVVSITNPLGAVKDLLSPRGNNERKS